MPRNLESGPSATASAAAMASKKRTTLVEPGSSGRQKETVKRALEFLVEAAAEPW